MKQILLANGKKTALMRAFKTTYPTVRAALRYQTDSELAKKIRFAAVKHCGGVEVDNQNKQLS